MTRDPSKLEQIFLHGQRPDPEMLVKGESIDEAISFAEWKVTMLTGWFPNLSGEWFRHRKSFIRVGDTYSGCNKFFRNTRWGYFDIAPQVTYKGDLKPALLLNYGVEANSFLTKPIYDLVRTTGCPNILIGRFYYKDDFSGYFSLTKL